MQTFDVHLIDRSSDIAVTFWRVPGATADAALDLARYFLAQSGWELVELAEASTGEA